jgi:hypothetical protein
MNKMQMRVREALKLAQVVCPTCLLCGDRSEWAGVWVPPDRLDHLFEQWHGEKQGFGYSLCDDCKKAPDVRERLEAELVAQHGLSQN